MLICLCTHHLFLCTLYLYVGSSVIKLNYPIFQFGFSTQAVVFSHPLPKNCWLPFLKDLQGFNLSAGSLVRLPKDCDAHLILARPGTFTYYYWSADPVNLRQLLNKGMMSSQSKLPPLSSSHGVMQQKQKKQLKTSEFQSLEIALPLPLKKLNILCIYTQLNYYMICLYKQDILCLLLFHT